MASGRSRRADGRVDGLTRRVGQALEHRALTLVAVATALALVALFYVPVGIVFSEAVAVRWSLSPPALDVSLSSFASVLTDPFYTGELATVVKNPFAVGRHLSALAGWVLAGFPNVRLGLFGFTAYQAFLSTVASLVIGLPGAYVLGRYEFRGRATLRALTIVPFILPSVMVAIGFVAMFGRNGTLNAVLSTLGLGRVELVGTLPLVLLAHAFYNAPLITRVTTAAYESVDTRTVETARSLGAGPRRAALDVVVPQLLPAILTGALLTFIFTFLSFPIVLALGGLQLATVEVWVYALIRDLDYAEAATLAALETALSLALTYAYLRYEARQASASRAANPPERTPLFPDLSALSDPRRLAMLGYGVVVCVVFVGPLASMVAESLTTAAGALTLDNYVFLLERQATGTAFQVKPLPAIRNSLTYALATLAVALPMGITVSVVAQRREGGRVLETLAMAPLAVSGVVTGVGLLLGPVFGIPLVGGWELSLTGPMAIVAAHAVAAYPFVTRNVSPLLAEVDRATVESARALGASRLRTLLDVEIPLVAAGVAAGAAFAFAISIGEFDSTVILAEGQGSYTMPVAVERFRGRRLGPATAMGTVLLVVTSVSFVVIDRLGGRYRG